jgi:hypothetical protein
MLDNPRRDQRRSDFLIDGQPHVEFSRAFRPADLRKLIAFDVCPRQSVSAWSVNKSDIIACDFESELGLRRTGGEQDRNGANEKEAMHDSRG